MVPPRVDSTVAQKQTASYSDLATASKREICSAQGSAEMMDPPRVDLTALRSEQTTVDSTDERMEPPREKCSGRTMALKIPRVDLTD